MTNDLYTNSTFEGLYTNRKEINLRQEMTNTLFGARDEIAKGRVGLLRRMRRDEPENGYPEGKLERCDCRDLITDEPELDFVCPKCRSMGYLWDEEEIVYYKNDDAYRKWGYTLFYVRYISAPTDEDFIVEIKRGADGTPVSPIIREKLYKIEEAVDFRGEDGRIEYCRIKALYDPKWSVWEGRYLDSGVRVRTPGAAD